VLELLELPETRDPHCPLPQRSVHQLGARDLDGCRDQHTTACVDGTRDPLPSHAHELRECDDLSHSGVAPYHLRHAAATERGRFPRRRGPLVTLERA